MKTINDKTRRRAAGWALPVLLAGGLLLGGCSSDSVAPQDAPPALTSADVAAQTGYVAMVAAMVGPETVEFAGKADKDSYTRTFVGPVAGTVYLDFTAGGVPSTWADADHVDLSTAPDSPLVVTIGLAEAPGTILLGFDLAAEIDRRGNPDQGVITGTGTYQSGPYAATFQFSGLAVAAGANYPASGTMSFSSGAHTGTVTYDGSSTASLVMDDGSGFVVDLMTGEVTPVGGA